MGANEANDKNDVLEDEETEPNEDDSAVAIFVLSRSCRARDGGLIALGFFAFAVLLRVDMALRFTVGQFVVFPTASIQQTNKEIVYMTFVLSSQRTHTGR